MTESSRPTSPDNRTAYDETPYPSASYSQSHPNRLAAMAQIFGLAAKSASKCRVLELGCADGANLLPMAELYQGASFLGIDTSKVQIEAGCRALAAVGLKNIELRCQGILDFPETEGEFDYIITHGVYSWVAEPVREKLLRICQQHLAENGVAYISYNALPGWNMRRSLRDMMLFHTKGLADPKAKIQQARALLKFLSDSVPAEGNAYGILLKSELQTLAGVEDGYLRHDLLGEENTPFYFHEFIAQAGRHGLQYLSEPSLASMMSANFPETVSQTLAKIGQNIVAQEQYMDFLKNRMFRQTLLCRSEVKLARNVGPDRIKTLAFQSALLPASGPIDLQSGVSVNFGLSGGNQLTATDTFLKAVFLVFANNSGEILSYSALLDQAQQLTRQNLATLAPNQDQIDDATLAVNLTNLIGKGIVEVYAEPVVCGRKVAERPQVSALMRFQAMNTRAITNRVHQPVAADLFGRHVIEACDGTRTQAEIVEHLVKLINDGALNLAESGQAVTTDEDRMRALLEPRVKAILAMLAQRGMFAP